MQVYCGSSIVVLLMFLRETKRERIPEQECIPVGCVLSAAVAMCIPECIGQGVCASQHALGRGVSAGGGCIPACTGADMPPCEQNDRQV